MGQMRTRPEITTTPSADARREEVMAHIRGVPALPPYLAERLKVGR